MNKLSSALLLIACAYAFVSVSAFDAEDFNDVDAFTEEEGLVQSPASDLAKAKAAAKAAQNAENKRTNGLHSALTKKILSSKSTRSAARAFKNGLKTEYRQGTLVRTFTRMAKRQARKNARLMKRQRQATNSAARNLARNHQKMVRHQSDLVKNLSALAASQNRMLARKKKAARFFAAQVKALAKASTKANKATERRLLKAKKVLKAINKTITSNKKYAKNIQKNFAKVQRRSQKEAKAIKRTFQRRQASLAKKNKNNLARYNRDAAKEHAKFIREANTNKKKAALAAARTKLQERMNKFNVRKAAKLAAKLGRKEARLKAATKRKEVGAKTAASKKLSESRQKEKIHKVKVSNEADTKYRRKAAHAAAMKKAADIASAAARAAVAASVKSTKAQEAADATQYTSDKNIKECSAFECLQGTKCIKVGSKTGFYLDQGGLGVNCTKKKPENLMSWGGSGFSESQFPEAHYVEPKFTMPVMPK